MLNRWLFRRPPSPPPLPLSPQQPLPEGLAARLRSMPAETFLCRDVDRLWAELLAGELDRANERRCREHLAGCLRCRRLVATFDDARRVRAELPPALAARLRRPSPSPAPFWILDLRYAAAVCYAAALCALAVCGEPAACLDHAQGLAQPVVAAVEQVEGTGRDAWRSFAAALRSGSERLRPPGGEGEPRDRDRDSFKGEGKPAAPGERTSS